jgi:hypothetical protein
MPATVIRSLIFVYEQQTAWVRWGNAKSSCFGITNGTHQGSVLSPVFFSVYIDDLLVALASLGLVVTLETSSLVLQVLQMISS